MESSKEQLEKAGGGEKITRKQAIKKVGITALAASSMLLLNSQARASASGGTGNPGNHKSVGKAGENPNGKGNWGDGDKGKSDGKKDKEKEKSNKKNK